MDYLKLKTWEKISLIVIVLLFMYFCLMLCSCAEPQYDNSLLRGWQINKQQFIQKQKQDSIMRCKRINRF